MKKRKPIQIEKGEGDYIVALCDDGSLWEMIDRQWNLLADIDDFNPPPVPDDDEKVLRFIVSSLQGGKKLSQRDIAGESASIGLPRRKIKTALTRLRLNKRIVDEDVPAEEKSALPTYVKPLPPPPLCNLIDIFIPNEHADC